MGLQVLQGALYLEMLQTHMLRYTCAVSGEERKAMVAGKEFPGSFCLVLKQDSCRSALSTEALVLESQGVIVAPVRQNG